MAAFLGGQLEAQELIADVYSYNSANPNDSDGVYLIGTEVNIIVTAKDNRADLQGTISITSAATRYSSVDRALDNMGAGVYRYVWRTTGLSSANDYKVSVRLRDADGDVSINESTAIELYAPGLLLRSVDSQDAEKPEDDDELYHAGQKIRIIVEYLPDEQPSGTVQISSEITKYKSDIYRLQSAPEKKLEYIWDTKGLNEAKDYRVAVTLTDRAGHQITNDSLIIAIDNTPPVILSVTSRDRDDSTDNDGIYHAGQTILIDVQARDKEANLEPEIIIKSDSVRYDSGPRRLTYQGDGLWRFIWTTTGLNAAKDYAVAVTLRDQAALESQDSSLLMEIDNTPPQNGKVLINDEEVYAISRQVTLDISADGATKMYVSGDVADDVSTFEWIPYAKSLKVELSHGDAVKRISVRFMDNARNESPAASDTIILDEQPPVIKSVGSYDEADRLDNDNIYHAGQSIIIVVDTSEELVELEGTLTITSATARYDSGPQSLANAGQGKYTYKWNTVGLLEAGDYVVSMNLKDPSDREVSDSSLRITIDNTPPSGGSAKINDGATETDSRSVNLSLSASGDPRGVFIEGDLVEDTNTFKWIDYTSRIVVNLTDTDGEKKVQAKFRDAARNVSGAVTAAIILDRKAPTSTSIVIQDDARYTATRNVTLKLRAVNAEKMLIDGDVMDDNLTFDFINYREQVPVTLTPKDGEKHVGVIFKNAVGIQSDRIEDTIILDTTEPVILSVDSSDAEDPEDDDEIYHPGQTIAIKLTAGAGEAKLDAAIRVRSQNTAYDTGEQEMERAGGEIFIYLWNTSALQESDDYTVFAELTDAAGYKAGNSDLRITIDSLPPSRGQVVINDGEEAANSRTVRLKVSAVDAVSMFVSGDVADDGNTFQWITYRTNLTVNLFGEDGQKFVYVKFKDAAGNESGNVTDSIELDRESPYDLDIIIAATSEGASAGKADEFATSQQVFLAIWAKNAVEMYISGDLVDDDATFEWISYSPQMAVNLSEGDGEKAVSAKFRNQRGIESEQIEGRISLDTSSPEILSVEFQDAGDPDDDDGWYHPGESVRIIVQAREANEPETEVTIKSESTGYNLGPQKPGTRSRLSGDIWRFEYIWDTEDLDDGTDFAVEVQLTDAAGWVSTHDAGILTLDSSPPTGAKMTINGGARRTASRIAKVEASAEDAVEMFVAGDLRSGDSNTFRWIPVKPSVAVILTSGEGLKNIEVRFRDLAENETEPVIQTVILSQSPPVIEKVDSWDTSDTSDNDEKYHAGELIKLAVKAKSRDNAPMIETGLQGKVSVNDSADRQAFEESGGWYTYTWNTVGLAEGNYMVRWKLSDGVGHEAVDSSLNILIDNTPPRGPGITINNGAEYTRSRSVNLSLKAVDASWVFIDGEVIDSKGATFEWIRFAEGMKITVSLAAGDGMKMMQARFKDDADNTTDIVSSQIILDTIGPEVISVEIGDGEEYTGSTKVKLKLKADDAAEMYIDGDVIAQSLARQWVPYQEEITLNLEEEDGEKTINVEFKDAVGNYSDEVSDTIILDTEPPEVDSVKCVNSEDPGDGDGRYMEGTQVEIEADAGEEGLEATIQIESSASGYASGTQKMEDSGGGIYTYLWDTNFLQAAEDYTAIIELKDRAGNSTTDESLIMAIFLEPLEQEVSINDGEEVTTSQSVQVKISADNAVEMRIHGDVVDDSTTYEWIEFASSKEVKLTPGDGAKTVKVTFRDSLSREIGSSEAKIRLDQTPPAIAEVTTAQKTYRAGETAEITIQAKKREAGLEGTVQVRSFSAGYDSGPQKVTERGGGQYSYLWDTAGLKEGTDYLVEVILSDEAEWTVRDQSLIVTIDNTPPGGGEITVNGGELFTQKRSVKLEFTPPDDAVDMFIEGDLVRDSNTFQWVDFSLFTQPLTINLSLGDGEKKVEIMFRDEAGNETEPIEKIVVLNELPPVIIAVDTYDEDEPKDNDEIYRSGRSIRLNITVEDRERLEPEDEENGEDAEGSQSLLEAWFRVRSEETGYDSGFLTAVREDDDRRPRIAEFSAVWNTSSVPEASDYVVEATLQDGFGQRTVDDSLTITVDNTPPAPPEVSIEGGKKSSNSRNVTLTVDAAEDDDDVVDMIVEGDVAESASTWKWVPSVDTKQIELSDGDGAKVVTVKVRDSAGNISEIASAEIALDRSVPSSLSISINEGAEYTESHQVTLSLTATSAREMFVSGSIVRDDNTFRWVPFQEEFKVRLTEGEGKKVVRAMFRNGIENESDEVESEIVLDISPPAIEDIEVSDAFDETDDDLVFHAGQRIMFQATAGKEEAGLEGFVSINGSDGQSYETGKQGMTDAGLGRYTYLWNTEGLEDGDYLCEVTLEDIAGHSVTDTVEIVIDNEGPGNPSITVDAELADSRSVEVALKADGDPAEVFIAGDVVNDDRTFEWIAFELDESDPTDEMRVSVNLRGTDGEKKVKAIFRDKARSESSEAEASVTLELKRPELAKSCRIIQNDDEPPLAYLVLQFDEPIEKVEPRDFMVVLRDKADPKNFVQIDGTSTVPILSKDTVMVDISAEQLDEIRQWQPMTFAYSYIQAEISENAVFDLADKGNLSNERTPADVYFALPDLSIQMGVGPSSFSPNADDVKDNLVIAYSPARTSDVTIRIVNLQKETVREWQVEDQTGRLTYSVEWNGKKPDGSTYPDGEYTVIIMSSEVGAAGFAYGLKQNFTIDTSAPQIVDIRPWEGAEVPVLFRATVSISDTPKTSGIESVYITVLGDVESKFPLVKSKTEGEYVLPATSELVLPPGDQDVTFHVVDMAGNEAEKTLTYTVVPEIEARLSIMNFPNPFPPGDTTNVRYSLPEEARNGEIAIYDGGGDMVFFKELTAGELERGEHTFQWDGRDMFGNILARGIYFCRLHVDMETEDESEVHKIAVR